MWCVDLRDRWSPDGDRPSVIDTFGEPVAKPTA
jgi:hypothetical protein